ncbi:Heavy metal-associated isoprenylated plant protein 26 [Hibiscus syriacus]|uniref:Heavy metal-associated isoprenylated plant protein 26 n=1 Tax=Hibiscus syriacus TaxID=106335 RepID=A0A6A3AB76_HIBSY|nr:heavy metal-associated isoprenylated plant protein 24-like [Hibiscus syriacus]KAE8701734.1 Heavy metal-associated isoprenylated plant protein 26 [Hibiscus syriacus]
MGVEGTLDYISDLLSNMKKKKKKQTQTVDLKIRMDCEGCARKVKKVLSGVKDVDLKQQKATVTGYVDPKKVLAAAQTTKKKVELWPYVPYTMVANPYVAQAYDKKAPPNHVRKVADPSKITETTVDDRYSIMFSDENPNACSVM